MCLVFGCGSRDVFGVEVEVGGDDVCEERNLEE